MTKEDANQTAEEYISKMKELFGIKCGKFYSTRKGESVVTGVKISFEGLDKIFENMKQKNRDK